MRSRPQIAVDDVLRMADSAGNAAEKHDLEGDNHHAPSIGTDRMRWPLPVGTRTVLPIETRRPTISSARPHQHTNVSREGNAGCSRGREAGTQKCSFALGAFGQAFARFAIALGKAR